MLQADAKELIWQITAKPPNPTIAVTTATDKRFSIAALHPVVTSQTELINNLTDSFNGKAEITDENAENINTQPHIPSIASVPLDTDFTNELSDFFGIAKSVLFTAVSSLRKRQKKPIVIEARMQDK